MQDYYEILGLTKSATPSEIKAAYKKLAKKYHPDVNQSADAQEKFKQVSKAYQTLSDENKKAAYDRYGHAAFEQASQNGYNPNSGGFGGQGGVNYDDLFSSFGGYRDPFDIFNEFFGGSSRQDQTTRARRGEDLEVVVNLDFKDAYQGAEKTVAYEKLDACPKCQGNGSQSQAGSTTCPQCQGSGQVRFHQSFLGAQFTQVGVCPTCQGEGQVIKEPCTQCKGSGRTKTKSQITVKIPAGVDTGMQIRYREKGNIGKRKQPAGDLYLTFKVKPHAVFTRHHQDILLQLPISPAQAALGDEIEVPTMAGKNTLTIPAGISHGTQLEIKNLGFANPNSGKRGSQLITIQIQVPTRLSREEKELYRQIKKVESKPQSLIDKLFN